MTSAAIQPNMNFMLEESYPCKDDGCDKVYYVKSDLKKHTKDHKKEMRKRKHCCCHCNKTISRAQNLKLHQQTCEQNENRKAYRRFYGVDVDESNGGFQLVQSALKNMGVHYRKNLNVNDLQLDDGEPTITQDVKNLL